MPDGAEAACMLVLIVLAGCCRRLLAFSGRLQQTLLRLRRGWFSCSAGLS